MLLINIGAFKDEHLINNVTNMNTSLFSFSVIIVDSYGQLRIMFSKKGVEAEMRVLKYKTIFRGVKSRLPSKEFLYHAPFFVSPFSSAFTKNFVTIK